MLDRYHIHRGKRAPGDPLPEGVRQDTRKHTRHCMRPDAARVTEYLADPSPASWKRFARDYRELVARRFREDREPFDRLAELAMTDDVHLGCSCPTAKNPDLRRCHTWLALEFMQRRYPKLDVRFPETTG